MEKDGAARHKTAQDRHKKMMEDMSGCEKRDSNPTDTFGSW